MTPTTSTRLNDRCRGRVNMTTTWATMTASLSDRSRVNTTSTGTTLGLGDGGSLTNASGLTFALALSGVHRPPCGSSERRLAGGLGAETTLSHVFLSCDYGPDAPAERNGPFYFETLRIELTDANVLVCDVHFPVLVAVRLRPLLRFACSPSSAAIKEERLDVHRRESCRTARRFRCSERHLTDWTTTSECVLRPTNSEERNDAARSNAPATP
jgi:hypothetical protein